MSQISGKSLGNNVGVPAYEEGTWIPTIDASVTSPTINYITRLGKYTLIGNKVTVKCNLNWGSNSGGSGDFQVTDLPFTSSNDIMRNIGGFLCNSINFDATAIYVVCRVDGNSSFVNISQMTDNSAFLGIPIADIGTGNFQLQLEYWI